MIRPLSARERRLVALLLLTAVLALVNFVLVAPVMAGFAARAERREQLMQLYAHNVGTIGAIPRLRRQAERARAATTGFVLDTQSAEAGREALKGRLQRAIEESGGVFREGADGEGRAGWAQARATARMSQAQLAATLARLQDAPPYLIIDSLTVGADTALVSGQPSALEVQIEASIPLARAR